MSRISFGAWAAMALMLAPMSGAQSYTITDIGEISRSASEPQGAINDHGAIVGNIINGNNLSRAFLWTAEIGVRDLGFLPGFDGSVATHINNAGHVVGYSTSSTTGVAHAFLWTQAGGMQDLGSLPGGNASYAYGINESDQVVGYSYIDNLGQLYRAFLWTANAGMQDIGTLGGSTSNATAINQSGMIVGSSYLVGDAGPYRAFAWTQAGGMEDLGVVCQLVVPVETGTADGRSVV